MSTQINVWIALAMNNSNNRLLLIQQVLATILLTFPRLFHYWFNLWTTALISSIQRLPQVTRNIMHFRKNRVHWISFVRMFAQLVLRNVSRLFLVCWNVSSSRNEMAWSCLIMIGNAWHYFVNFRTKPHHYKFVL